MVLQPKEPVLWACAVCTYNNQPSRYECELCQTPNPHPPEAKPAVSRQKSAPAKKGADAAAADEGKDKDAQRVVNNSDMLYHQLRSRGIKALCNLILHPPSTITLIKSGLLPALLEMAVRPTALEGFKSVPQLEQTEVRSTSDSIPLNMA